LNYKSWNAEESHWIFLGGRDIFGLSSEHGFHTRAGVSNSEWLAGRIRLKGRSCRPHFKKWKKLPLNFQLKTKHSIKNRQIVYELKKTAEFLVFAGYIETSRGSHAARGPRVWDRCTRRCSWRGAVGTCLTRTLSTC